MSYKIDANHKWLTNLYRMHIVCNMKTLCAAYLSPVVAQELTRIAKAEGISRSHLIERLVEQFVFSKREAYAVAHENIDQHSKELGEIPKKSKDEVDQEKLGQEKENEEQQEEQEIQEEEQEELDIEALFITEQGRVIFRNGLLRGIIHKYAEIDDVVSKIQDLLLKGVKFHLVYKAFDFDVGDKAQTFHKKCDYLDMSLVLIETDKGIRFGGFTTESWAGNCLIKNDNNAFVFSLETTKIFDVIKDEPAIGCYPKFGPVFFGCQIRIYDKFFTDGGSTCRKGLNYNTTEDYELNNGGKIYLVKDIEVYAIETIDVEKL